MITFFFLIFENKKIKKTASTKTSVTGPFLINLRWLITAACKPFKGQEGAFKRARLGLISVFETNCVITQRACEEGKKKQRDSSHHCECCNILWRCEKVVRVKYGHVRLQQMHLAAHLLTRERLWILKGFQREVIHNFDCISSSWRDAVYARFLIL